MDTRHENQKSYWWRSATLKIYANHVLASWGDRTWSFALGIYLYYLYPNSLQLTAIYGFTSCISIIIFGPVIGKWIDRTERLKGKLQQVAKLALFVQNFAVTLCAALCVLKISLANDIDPIWNGALEIILMVVIICIGVLVDLGTVAIKIALEKDWIVVLAKGDENKLAQLNSVMRTIDLTTTIVSPIIIGQVITYVGKTYSAAFIVVWNIFSYIIEYYLLSRIYKQMLNIQKNCALVLKTKPESSNNHENSDIQMERNLTCFSYVSIKLIETRNSWKDYYNHYVRNAGLALSLLYMTVLGFDNITIGYALSQGVSESYLGIFTAIGGVFGILGSVSFPWLRKTFGKFVTGNIGFGSETVALLACVASIFTQGSPLYDKIFGNGSSDIAIRSDGLVTYSFSELWDNNISVLLLLTGIVLARFGLWVADINVSQIFQENIAESQRGSINGVQDSLNQGMNLIKYALVIIFPNAATFPYLISVSWLAILLGWILFMIFCWQKTHRKENYSVLLVQHQVHQCDDDAIIPLTESQGLTTENSY